MTDDAQTRIEEQLLFFERELEHQRDQLQEIWADLRAVKRAVERLERMWNARAAKEEEEDEGENVEID